MSKGRFSQFEQRIEQLVEGSFARLFAGRLHPREVATRLARAMEDHVRIEPDGTAIAPNRFNVMLNPDDLAVLMESQPALQTILIETVVDLAHRGGLLLIEVPVIKLNPAPELALHAIQVEAAHTQFNKHSTQALKSTKFTQAVQKGPRNPQVVLHGSQYIPLDRPVINIGRRRDNHIVIDDVRVSRSHAQLRLRFGRYVLYDLGSSGGTSVNENAITECILKPGDVISLAGVLLVYMEDDPSTGNTPPITDTQVRNPGDPQPAPRDDDPTL